MKLVVGGRNTVVDAVIARHDPEDTCCPSPLPNVPAARLPYLPASHAPGARAPAACQPLSAQLRGASVCHPRGPPPARAAQPLPSSGPPPPRGRPGAQHAGDAVGTGLRTCGSQGTRPSAPRHARGSRLPAARAAGPSTPAGSQGHEESGSMPGRLWPTQGPTASTCVRAGPAALVAAAARQAGRAWRRVQPKHFTRPRAAQPRTPPARPGHRAGTPRSLSLSACGRPPAPSDWCS